METAAWISAVSTAVYTLTFLFTAIFVVGQLRESRLQRQVSILQDAYRYIISTSDDRKVIYDNQVAIRSIDSIEKLDGFVAAHPDIARSIHSVANCYQYVGFLWESDALPSIVEFLEEGGDTVLRIDGIIGSYIELMRQKTSQPRYKRYYQMLVAQAAASSQ